MNADGHVTKAQDFNTEAAEFAEKGTLPFVSAISAYSMLKSVDLRILLKLEASTMKPR
jgi:hypothetical protein